MLRAALVLMAAAALAGGRGSPSLGASPLDSQSAGAARLYTSVSATKHCLVGHRLLVEAGSAYWPSAHKPTPVAHFIFADHGGDNGYIMFYRSAALASEASARWWNDQQREICLPLGHTLAWCNAHLPVPGTRQTAENVVIDWIGGPKTLDARRTVTACLR